MQILMKKEEPVSQENLLSELNDFRQPDEIKMKQLSKVVYIILSFLYLTLDIEESAAMIFYLMACTMFIIGIANAVLSFSMKGMSPRKVREIRGNT